VGEKKVYYVEFVFSADGGGSCPNAQVLLGRRW